MSVDPLHQHTPAREGPAAADPPEPLCGHRVGRYRVGPVVAAGAMSTLYRAHDVRLDRAVALKVISPLLAGDEEFRARFIGEARALSALEHPHVVPLYDHDELDGHLFLAMRWIDGPSLADLLTRGPLTPGRALRLLEQTAAALDAVHHRGLVHLDVKPGNVLLAEPAPGDSGRHVYLADFGLTRRGHAVAATTGGDFLGSPAYAAPEHLRGQVVGPAADVYALGCLTYAALAGAPPHGGAVGDVVAAHLDARAPTPVSIARSRLRPDSQAGLAVGSAVDRELCRALAPDPAHRHPSAGVFAAAVRAAAVQDAADRDAAARDATSVAGARGPRPSPRPGPSSVHAVALARRVAPPTAPGPADAFTRPPIARRAHLTVSITVVAALAVLVALIALVLFVS